MILKLETKLSPYELNELKRRASMAMEQMLIEGLSIGRELGSDVLHTQAEELIYKKIAELSEFIITDKIWQDKIPSPKEKDDVECMPDNVKCDEEAPDWSLEDKPFN